jgi:hypothetical protein
VKILSVETSCTCMQFSVIERAIKGGETGRVHCVFHVPNALGSVRKTVILKTDDAGQPEKIVPVRVEVPGALHFEPARLTWKTGAPAEEAVSHITVAGGAPLKVTSVECSRDLFTWSLKTIREGWEYELVVKPRSTEQPAMGMFLLHSDSEVPRQKVQSAFAVIERAAPSVSR